MHSDTPILNAAFTIVIVATFFAVCELFCGCATNVATAPVVDASPSLHELESGTVACNADAPKLPFTALGLPTTLTGEQGPPASVCTCDGGKYHCWAGAVLECKSTIVIDESVVTPSESACPKAQWLGHDGETGKNWVWCCQ